MYKQIWLYDGTEILLESRTEYDEDVSTEIFDYPDQYTEIKPQDGLYEPIFFDGEKWVGTDKEVWEDEHPQENIDLGINIEDVILMSEELLMQNADLAARIEILEHKGDA